MLGAALYEMLNLSRIAAELRQKVECEMGNYGNEKEKAAGKVGCGGAASEPQQDVQATFLHEDAGEVQCVGSCWKVVRHSTAHPGRVYVNQTYSLAGCPLKTTNSDKGFYHVNLNGNKVPVGTEFKVISVSGRFVIVRYKLAAKPSTTFTSTTSGIAVHVNGVVMAYVAPRTGGNLAGKGIFLPNVPCMAWVLKTDESGCQVACLVSKNGGC